MMRLKVILCLLFSRAVDIEYHRGDKHHRACYQVKLGRRKP